jgi:hypothetical protein
VRWAVGSALRRLLVGCADGLGNVLVFEPVPLVYGADEEVGEESDDEETGHDMQDEWVGVLPGEVFVVVVVEDAVNDGGPMIPAADHAVRRRPWMAETLKPPKRSLR